jgi:hypothetical protein
MSTRPSRTLGDVQISASQGCMGATDVMAMIWRIAGGARVWIRPTRL